MIRIAIAACLVTIAAAPAWAVDYCKTSVNRGGHAALMDGLVDGATLKALRAVSAARKCVDAATLAIAPDDAEDEEF